jgi:hypothetical protein
MNAVLTSAAERYPLLRDLLTKHLKWTLGFFAALFVVISASLYAEVVLTADADHFTTAGPIIGGDFMVFRHAAEAAGSVDRVAIYDWDYLNASLEETYPGRGEMNFGWMYPPTMYLVIAPFAAPDYLSAFALWVAIFAGAFFIAVHRLWANKWALFFLASSPAVFQAIITGQNGFLTATLILLAGAFADRRPVLAGIAAGLLTIKPQLGLLIPIAFLAAGSWRAFLIAAATALSLAAASLVLHGAEVWTAFVEGMTAHGARMGGAGFPFEKLVTPYGFAASLGAPAAFAGGCQLIASLSLVVYVFIVWGRVKDWDLRLAALSTSAILTTPYAFYYEFVIVAPAMFLIARRGVMEGWLRGERFTLIAIWALPLEMPGPEGTPQLSISVLCALLAFAIAARRVLPAAGIRFASARKPAPAGS